MNSQNNGSIGFQETGPQINWPVSQNLTSTNMKKAKANKSVVKQVVAQQNRVAQNEQKQLMNTLINFYEQKQQKVTNKKLNTQKLQLKESLANNSGFTTNELYLKGIRNSSASAASH